MTPSTLNSEAAYYDPQNKVAYWISGYVEPLFGLLRANALCFSAHVGAPLELVRLTEIRESDRFKYMWLFEAQTDKCPEGFTECVDALNKRIFTRSSR